MKLVKLLQKMNEDTRVCIKNTDNSLLWAGDLKSIFSKVCSENYKVLKISNGSWGEIIIKVV